MAKIQIRQNIKFKKLRRSIGLCDAYVVGHLECLWHTAYDMTSDKEPTFRDADEIEIAADWQGDDGVLCAALLDAGFIEQIDDGFRIHDLLDHAPEYVKKRHFRRTTSDNGGQCPTTADNGRNRTPTKKRKEKNNQEKNKETTTAIDFDSVPIWTKNGAVPVTEPEYDKLVERYKGIDIAYEIALASSYTENATQSKRPKSAFLFVNNWVKRSTQANAGKLDNVTTLVRKCRICNEDITGGSTTSGSHTACHNKKWNM